MSMDLPAAIEVVGPAFRRLTKIVQSGAYFVVRFEGIRTENGLVILTDPPNAQRRLKGRKTWVDVGYFGSMVKAYVFVEELAYYVGADRLDHSAYALASREPSHLGILVDYGRMIEPSSTAEAFVPLLAELECASTDEMIKVAVVDAQAAAIRADSDGEVSDEDLEHILEAAFKRALKSKPGTSNARSLDVPLMVDYGAISNLVPISQANFEEVVAPSAMTGPFRITAQEIMRRGSLGRSFVLIAQIDPGVDRRLQESINRLLDGVDRKQGERAGG